MRLYPQNMINRTLQTIILSRLSDKKVILLLGPRQSGKSTLMHQLEPSFKKPYTFWNGDEADLRAALEHPTSTRLKALIGKYKTLVIDEAQRIQNIGLCLKLIHDKIPGIKILATGSSAFELSNKINEPLTGRKWEYQLLPMSFGEMVAHSGLMEEKRLLSHRLIYGYYPEIVTEQGSEESLLIQLASSYLYKDILTWERIQKPAQLEKLVQALAFQVGQIISYNELGQLCGLNNETIEKYITLLEKSFILYRLPSYSGNLRNELKKSFKVFFYDNGLRNAAIQNFKPIELRQDAGQLWENWFVSERLKYHFNNGKTVRRYFWRTLEQQEVDYVEETGKKLIAFECKYNPKAKALISRGFTNAYPDAATHIVHKENFDEWLL